MVPDTASTCSRHDVGNRSHLGLNTAGVAPSLSSRPHGWGWGIAIAGVGAALVLGGCSGSESTGGAESIAPAIGATASTGPDNSESATAARRFITIGADDVPPLTAVAPAAVGGPQRIVSLATGVGETLVALGVGDRVVGRDEASQEPASAEVVTKAHEISAERILALEPDLVIVDARTTPPEALDQIRATGVEIVEVPEAWTLNDIAPRVKAVADAIGVDASPLLSVIPEAAPSTGSDDAPRVAFLYLRGTSAVYLLGGAGSGADAMITAAGGVDVGATAGLDAFVPLTAEALIDLQPDVLLVMTKGLESVDGLDGLLALPGVAQTPAGESGRVIAVDDDLLLSFGPRTAPLAELLRAAVVEVTTS